jgi:hypothetical protein
VDPAAQVLGPVYPFPPHCPHFGTVAGLTGWLVFLVVVVVTTREVVVIAGEVVTTRVVVATLCVVVVALRVVVPNVVLVTGVVPPPNAMIAARRGSYQQFASLVFPLLLGWTPSLVSVVVSKPVAQSTTVIGDAAVDFPGAHAAIAAL